MNPVEERLRRRIEAEGPLPFAAFMEEALYGEGGYYRRPRAAIGEGGDFVTGSSLSPLFGRSTARLLCRLDAALGQPAELVEVGYGNGDHLAAALGALEEGEGPGSPRRVRAVDRAGRPLPPPAVDAERLAALEEIPEGEVAGLIFSYELFDALPVHRLIGGEEGDLEELWVGLAPPGEERAFAWQQRPLSDPALARLLGGARLAPGQVADLAPGWEPLYRQLARRLNRGLLVTCDYGFERAKLLDVRVRRHGTLACYRQQRVHRDPFVAVGEQDLTAHVDFSSLIAAGEAEGLTTVALTRQALWLTACGLFEELAQPAAAQHGVAATLRAQAMALLDGEGMGQETRVLVQARGVEAAELLDLAVLRAAS
jgi:SAM-dependent MidA family methyltransferase